MTTIDHPIFIGYQYTNIKMENLFVSRNIVYSNYIKINIWRILFGCPIMPRDPSLLEILNTDLLEYENDMDKINEIIVQYLYELPNIKNINLYEFMSTINVTLIDIHGRVLLPPPKYIDGVIQTKIQYYVDHFTNILKINSEYPGLFYLSELIQRKCC